MSAWASVRVPAPTLVKPLGKLLPIAPPMVSVSPALSTPKATAPAGADTELSAVLLGGYGGAWLDAAELAVPYAPGPLNAAGMVPTDPSRYGIQLLGGENRLSIDRARHELGFSPEGDLAAVSRPP